ncbi:hypothetical protein JCM19037_1922 [Geomicrobium sp. JCM 19037]|uniref:YncE family protein n=1 Tax=Geomicrobium sp. JCM 19037 TaxID=1460634 RepID=UPI00045F3A12|nr:hypothetical protein [Geomicrobium sp. JCM 19037]GAK03585.1 hypothetical protein JCM19037_1922 [Geomicrobium sp. JCM 19037]
MRKRITINNNLINGPGNVPPTQPTSPTTPTSPTQPTQPTPPVPPLENILFIGRNGGITVYDVARNQVITEIESTGTPNDIFINQPMNVLYATSQQGLSVIDLSTYQLIAQTPVPMSGIFNEIGYNPDNNTVYVGADFRVFGFDASNNYELIATIDVPRTGGTSGRFALNPSTSLGYLPVSPFNMYVLDLLNNSWASTINTAPNYAGSVATNAATNFIYNTNSSTSVCQTCLPLLTETQTPSLQQFLLKSLGICLQT